MKHREKTPSRPLPRLIVIGMVVAGFASLSGLGYMLKTAIEMVAAGRGLETYRTFWLVEFNWLSFLVLCGAIFVALVIGFVMRLREHLHWRSLERKYRGNNNCH